MMEVNRQGLQTKIRELRDRIRQTREKRTLVREQNTKNVFINPLLQALGWDLLDLDEVSLEYRRKPQDNPVDYALFILRAPCLFVEAKGLEGDLNDRKWIAQTISYATVVGVEWCVLTNGDEYRLYNAHAPVDVEEKLFRSVRITGAVPEEYLLDTLSLLSRDTMAENRLNVLWKAHFVDRRVKAALEELARVQDEGLVRLLQKRTKGLTPGDVRNSLKRAELRVDFPTVHEPAGVPVPPTVAVPEKRPASDIVGTSRGKKSPQAIPGTLRDLIAAGLIQPPMELEVTYKGVRITAIVEADGGVMMDGMRYGSLSVAGGMARNAVSGPPKDGRPYYHTNGWTFWRYRDPETGRLEMIDRLRQQYVERLVVPGTGYRRDT